MWRSLKNSKPADNIRVKIKHMTTGIGAPERVFDDYETTGWLRKGVWTIRQNGNIKHGVEPTHWDFTKKNW